MVNFSDTGNAFESFEFYRNGMKQKLYGPKQNINDANNLNSIGSILKKFTKESIAWTNPSGKSLSESLKIENPLYPG